MEKKILFQKNARVLTAGGNQIGHIDRVVLNPQTRVVTHIVVHKDSILKREDKVLPVDLIAKTDPDQIVLREEAGDLEFLPPFEERHLVDTEGDVERSNSSGSIQQPNLMGFPGSVVSIGSDSGEKFVTQIEQNIPQGTVALKEGAKVISSEGKPVGKVERILAEAPADRATHLLVSKGMFNKEVKLIPLTLVQMILEGEVHLRIKEDTLKEITNAPIAG